jgi:hypothetical protein
LRISLINFDLNFPYRFCKFSPSGSFFIHYSNSDTFEIRRFNLENLKMEILSTNYQYQINIIGTFNFLSEFEFIVSQKDSMYFNLY